MEIWIVGGIIVALMIYASTRIKRIAESAYQRESIETDEFVIIKPDGYISPVESEFAFEAWTKEFGESEAAEEIHRSRATVVTGPATAAAGSAKTERDENGVKIKEFRKTLNSGERSYELTVSVLADHFDEFNVRVREMLDSFELK